ncbi:DEAD/DEAH box helicase (plasmid) [Salimicrobium jeotgali]|uniref:Type I restriction enzyme endonuclease subunit n=1 Tax=Salimicrobium jeotgali TaxID=1230341 RepID=K2H4U5_9BACI|nr:type I restriction endonuclease subunit R [Salimicrobium jeotgali]AKN01834.1 DEAD/DEAH box helicase [Salimicrobium jeotgali]EKE30895.1 type i site-specific deoxyribonuclease, hsdr family protein [Salimicrobium jeotgali]MBM7697585.1 type I restriction enzyme R subunit [Salimicrobium jeotgali]
MSGFSEDELEQATLELFEEMEFEVAFGPDLAPEGSDPERPNYQTVVLEYRLYNALTTINPEAQPAQIEEAMRQVTTAKHPNLLMNNRDFHRFLTDGIDVTTAQAGEEERTEKLWLMDPDKADNNDFLAVNQFTVVEGRHDKRPDVVVFINGLPVVVFELKSSSNEHVGLPEAYNQLQTYKATIPSLFQTNAFLVTSDGLNARAGTLTASEEWFTMWRSVDGEAIAPKGMPQIEVLIRGMFQKRTLLDIIHHFVLFQEDDQSLVKILAAYHQYYAVNKAMAQTGRAISEEGDRKIGVIWHTQGSGKSLSMVFYSGKLILGADNPTIVVLTDRNDLDEQLYTTFSQSSALLRQKPKQAESRKHLKELLSVDSGGVVFTTMHKFAPDGEDESLETFTSRTNVIVMADEAHRSQYGFEAEVQNKRGKAKLKYGFAKYLRDALPNASFIGFTGTPVELEDKNTPAVFGNYIDVYDMTQAVEDGATVRIYYESRIIQLDMPKDNQLDVDSELEDLTEDQEFEDREKLKSKWSRLEALAGAESRVKRMAQDIVEHYEKRQGAIDGKAMAVVMSRRIAIDLYQEITRLRPDWHSDDDDKGVIKVVMTGNSSDPEGWHQHTGNKRHRDYLAKRMKDNEDPLKIVIVRDMWLTGFDVPSMHTMYIDKPMKGHNLMQAIARVNRVFRDKPGGLVVDYIGFADNLKEALKQYTEEDKKNAGVDTSLAAEIMQEKYELLTSMLHGHDYQKFYSEKQTERMQAIVETVDVVLAMQEEQKKDFLRLVTELSKAYALCATTEEAQALNAEVGFFKSVKSGVIKLLPEGTQKKTAAQIDDQINQLISKSIISEEVVDVYGSLGLENPDISILSDHFLKEVEEIPQKNIAVELLNRLLQGKIKNIQRKNLVQSKKFSELLENALNKYNKRAIEASKVIEELIELAKQVNDAYQRGEESNLSDDEIAFYDALASNESAQEVMGDETLQAIAHELTKSIKANMSIDWNLRESARAKMRTTVKHLLRRYGYPPDLQKMAVDTVVQQAELMATNEKID